MGIRSWRVVTASGCCWKAREFWTPRQRLNKGERPSHERCSISPELGITLSYTCLVLVPQLFPCVSLEISMHQHIQRYRSNLGGVSSSEYLSHSLKVVPLPRHWGNLPGWKSASPAIDDKDIQTVTTAPVPYHHNDCRRCMDQASTSCQLQHVHPGFGGRLPRVRKELLASAQVHRWTPNTI